MLELQPFITEQEWTADGIPVLSATVSVPQPVSMSDRISRRISRFYQSQHRAYLKYCRRELFPKAEAEYRAALATSAPFTPFRAKLSFQITYQNPHFLSLYTQSCEETGAQKWCLRHGDTWDLASGYPVPLSSFFAPHSSWKRYLLNLAEESIERQEQMGLSQYHEHSKRLLKRYFNPQNYYLTPDGLAFFYPMYAIAPAFEGIPTFLVPYGTLGLQSHDTRAANSD